MYKQQGCVGWRGEGAPYNLGACASLGNAVDANMPTIMVAAPVNHFQRRKDGVVVAGSGASACAEKLSLESVYTHGSLLPGSPLTLTLVLRPCGI